MRIDPDISDIQVVLGIVLGICVVAAFIAMAGVAAQGCQDALLRAMGFPK